MNRSIQNLYYVYFFTSGYQVSNLWSKPPASVTLEDALEVLEEHKDDPQKAKLAAKAFEILGREAVLKEMLA